MRIFCDAKRPMCALELATEAQKRGYVFEGRCKPQACLGALLQQNPALFTRTKRMKGSGAPWLWILASSAQGRTPLQKTPPPPPVPKTNPAAGEQDPKRQRYQLIADRMRVLEGEGLK
jgi:hypothetical protein